MKREERKLQRFREGTAAMSAGERKAMREAIKAAAQALGISLYRFTVEALEEACRSAMAAKTRAAMGEGAGEQTGP